MESDTDIGKRYSYSTEPDDELLRRAIDIASDESLAQAERNSYLCFTVGGASYAIESGAIRQVLSARVIVSVPFAPDFILGIAHHEGDFLSVVDLPALVSATPTRVPVSHLLVLADDEARLCIATETVPFTMSVSADEILPTHEAAPSWIAELLVGVLLREGAPIGILSARNVMNHRRLRSLLEAAETREAS